MIGDAFGLPRHTISVDIHADVDSVPTIRVVYYDCDSAGRIMLSDGIVKKIDAEFALIPKEIFNRLPPDIIERIRNGGD